MRRVYSSDPGISVSIDKTKLKPGKEAVITATVDTAQLPGALLNARVAVITNAPALIPHDPGHPTQIIRLVGEK